MNFNQSATEPTELLLQFYRKEKRSTLCTESSSIITTHINIYHLLFGKTLYELHTLNSSG